MTTLARCSTRPSTKNVGAVETSPAIIPELRQGYPPAKLLEATHDAQLLVVGSRGVGALKGALLGSVSHHCTMHSTVPVAVVRESVESSLTDEVVVGIDGSDEAAAALRWAIREAVVRRSKLVVIHAWHFDAKTAPADYRYAAVNKRTFTERSEALVEKEVENAIAAVGATPDPVVLVSSCQPPVQALVDRAGATGLLVVGSRGRGGCRRFAAGLRQPALPPPGARCGRRRSPSTCRPRLDGSGAHRLSAPRWLKRAARRPMLNVTIVPMNHRVSAFTDEIGDRSGDQQEQQERAAKLATEDHESDRAWWERTAFGPQCSLSSAHFGSREPVVAPVRPGTARPDPRARSPRHVELLQGHLLTMTAWSVTCQSRASRLV